MNIIDDDKPNITPISSFGEFKLIDRLTKNFKYQNKNLWLDYCKYIRNLYPIVTQSQITVKKYVNSYFFIFTN